MTEYTFIGKQLNTTSSNDFETLEFENITPFIRHFTIFKQPQIGIYKYPSSETQDEVSGEFTTNARVKFDLIFSDFKDHDGHTIIGNTFTVEQPELRHHYHQQLYGQKIAYKPIKNIYNLRHIWCGGSLIIYEDMDALLMVYGSGIHYQQVYKGYVKKNR